MVMAQNTDQAAVLAIFPSPGMGHLIPLAEFAKQLVHHHKFAVKFIIASGGEGPKAEMRYVDVLAANSIDSIHLPLVQLEDMPKDAKAETRISLTMARSLPAFRRALKSLMESGHLVALVVDLFGTDAFDAAHEIGVDPYIFYPSTAMALSLFFQLPALDTMISCEYREMVEPIKIPGCVPIRGKDLLDPAQDRKNDAYRWLLRHVRRYKEAKGIAVNSFEDLEWGAIEWLRENGAGLPQIYPVGPLIQAETTGEEECMKWLNEQPAGSVIFVSFGSGGTLTIEQTQELAFGLEMSGQRFLWVARSPSEREANAAFFTGQSDGNPFDFLPPGFLDRTRGIGLVVPSWAPQLSVLAHESTGGFLTHCGWNSVLESVVKGVPLVAWPLYAEQKMNAEMLVEGIKIAIRPETNGHCVVQRQEIARVVKALMEGEEGKRLRSRLRMLKEAAAKALKPGGCSHRAMAALVHQLNSAPAECAALL